MSQKKAWIVIFAIALVSGVLRVVVLPQWRASRLQPRALPGFSVSLPDGKTLRDEEDYPRGTFLVGFGPGLTGASWQPDDGTPMANDDLETLAKIIAGGFGKIPKGKATPVPVEGPDGKPTASIRIDAGDEMWMTMVPCGLRQVVITTIASRFAERVHRGVVRSLRCTPEEPKEAALKRGGSALFLELAGWHILEKSPSMLQLTDDKAIVMLQSVPDNIENAVLPPVFEPMMKAQGITMTFDPPRDGRVPFTMKTADATLIGWARVFHCPRASEAMLAFAESDEVAQSLWRRVGQSRCLKAGEAAQSWPASAKQ